MDVIAHVTSRFAVLARERILSRLALGDDVASLPAHDLEELDVRAVDPRNAALVRLGALLALDPSTASLHRAATEAQLAGVSPDEIVRCLVSLVPTLGVARISSVAPGLALVLGFDVDAAMEEHRPARDSQPSVSRREVAYR
jgi:hypothetical protein